MMSVLKSSISAFSVVTMSGFPVRISITVYGIKITKRTSWLNAFTSQFSSWNITCTSPTPTLSHFNPLTTIFYLIYRIIPLHQHEYDAFQQQNRLPAGCRSFIHHILSFQPFLQYKNKNTRNNLFLQGNILK